MKPIDQQTVIAEYCGWTDIRMGKDYECNDNPFDRRVLVGIHGEAGKHDVPDYLNDLNAMHKAEKFLTFEQWTDYEQHLIFDIVLPANADYIGFQTIHATASQKAAAYIKAINKWKE